MTDRTAASYRDRHSGVHFEGNKVVRTFDDQGAQWFISARDAGLLGALLESGHIVDHAVVSTEPLVVEAPRLPAVTYPYEWTSSMLRAAGVATIEIAAAAWEAGFHLRDASAFNIVFDGGHPVMVDLGSFRPGHTPFFLAYGQFCDHFLNPLAVASTTGVSPSQLWTSLEGLSAVEARRLMRSRSLKPRFIRHIWARASLEAKSESLAAEDRRSVRTELGLPPTTIQKTLHSLRDLLQSIEVTPGGTWAEYETECSYDADANRTKTAFIEAAAARAAGNMALDMGANTGSYSNLIAGYFETVVAIEPDEAAADVLWQRIQIGDVAPNVSIMLLDIMDPSGGRGFLNRERPPAIDRIAGADLVLWLAVLHHLVLSRNLPLGLVFDFAKDLSSRHVFEHVAPDDPMSELLLSSRDEPAWPMGRDDFERELGSRFRIVESCDVNDTRRLYEVVAR